MAYLAVLKKQILYITKKNFKKLKCKNFNSNWENPYKIRNAK